jgi:hypothetical protein
MTLANSIELPRELFFVQAAKRHPAVTLALFFAAGAVLVVGPGNQEMVRLAALAGVAVSLVIIDVVFLRWPLPSRPFPVRNPGTETLVVAILYLVAGASLIQRYEGSGSPSRILGIVGLISIFPIALAGFLLIRGYRLGDFGIHWRGFRPVPLIMISCGTLMALVVPLTVSWRQGYQEMGSVWKWIEYGVFVAALPEEFLRMVWQTRLGAWLHNRAVGWFLAALMWSALHGPLNGQGHTLAETLFLVGRLIPVGLLWGYLTFRSQSILPSVLLHATRFVWGG